MVQILKYVYILTFFLVVATVVSAQDTQVQVTGIEIFVEKRCYTCHTIKSESEKVEIAKQEFAKSKGVELKEDDDEKEESKGGDLSDVGNQRNKEWLTDFVKTPKNFFKGDSKCKRLAKKKYRKRFKGSDEEYEILITYLSTLKYGNQQDADFESCLKEE